MGSKYGAPNGGGPSSEGLLREFMVTMELLLVRWADIIPYVGHTTGRHTVGWVYGVVDGRLKKPDQDVSWKTSGAR